jgi:hypothetical protein
MSIRRRNVQNRVATALHYEREAHQQTKALLAIAIAKVDNMTAQRDIVCAQRDRFLELANELGHYFRTDPPAALSRNSALFQLLEEVAPAAIPSLPPEPEEVLQGMLGVASVIGVADLAAFVADIKSTNE